MLKKNVLESISALKAAIIVLSQDQGGVFLQVPQSHILSVAATLQHEMSSHSDLFRGIITPSQKQTVASFIRAPQDYFDAKPTFKRSYAPQSGEIFGVLTQMLQTFGANLSQPQEKEMANQKAYEDLKAPKEDEIAAGQNQIDKKTAELCDTDEKNAQAKKDIEDTSLFQQMKNSL